MAIALGSLSRSPFLKDFPPFFSLLVGSCCAWFETQLSISICSAALRGGGAGSIRVSTGDGRDDLQERTQTQFARPLFLFVSLL